MLSQQVGHIFLKSRFDDNEERQLKSHLKINNEIIDPNRSSFFSTTPFRFIIITLPGKNDYQTVRRKKNDLF